LIGALVDGNGIAFAEAEHGWSLGTTSVVAPETDRRLFTSEFEMDSGVTQPVHRG
jgi:hypothetical protein